ncbi:MAG TPA: ATP-binding protein [Thermoanaerobaculia bacterium]|nr:ATP-binding protein [Thermoanaerobaculia bacterium]
MLKRLERLVGRWWRRRRVDRRAFQELGRSLALIVDREALKSSVAARIRELFDPDRLIVLEPDLGEAVFQPGFSFGLDPAELEGVELPARGKLARWLTVNEVSFVRDRQSGVFDYLDPAEKDLFDRLRVTVAVPMVSLNRMTGILLLGWDQSGRQLLGSDLELLQLLASQASLAFENAALYRAQQERLDRLHRAERLAAVGQLAAGVAHEIRNPLTAIRSTMQYLLQGLDPAEPRHQLVAEILSEVDRINGTVGGLLSLSRAGEVHLTETDLTDLVSTSIHLVQARAGEQGVVLEARLGSEPLRVLADAGQLKQVFLNLLLNALQSMPGGGRITVTASPWRSPLGGGQRWAQVRIADTGPGIPSDQLRHIFDPFYTTKREGTGLGLAICYGIVERHQGEIQLESELGKGTTASVRLPLAEKKAWPTS